MSGPQESNSIQTSSRSSKKLLENPLISSMVVPVAIVLVGALIIFGVTKMLSTERSYKDLVREMHSKTFGNRWVAAYELSKLISTSQIPAEEVPWLLDNLSEIYNKAVDSRTRDFVIVAMGALRTERAIPTFTKALNDEDSNVRFHALVALGNLPTETTFDYSQLYPYLQHQDHALKQAAILALATHRDVGAQEQIELLLNDSQLGIRYAAATALVNYKSQKALPLLKAILLAKGEEVLKSFNVDQLRSLKLNVLVALQKNNWKELNETVAVVAHSDQDGKVQAKAREVLNMLKN